jgi:hypothetical protein
MLTIVLAFLATVNAPPVWVSVDTKLLKPGFEALLGQPGAKVDKEEQGLVAIDIASWIALQKTADEQDSKGLDALVDQKRLFTPNLGDRLKIIDYRKDGYVEIQMISGSCKSKKGFITAKFVCTRA